MNLDIQKEEINYYQHVGRETGSFNLFCLNFGKIQYDFSRI